MNRKIVHLQLDADIHAAALAAAKADQRALTAWIRVQIAQALKNLEKTK